MLPWYEPGRNQPEQARPILKIATTYVKPIKARHPGPIRPSPAVPGVRGVTLWRTRVGVVATAPEDNSDLAAVVDAWPDLPEAIKAGIVAMVKAAKG